MKKKDWKQAAQAEAAECDRAHKQTLILSEALRAVALSKDHAEAVMFACNALDWHILPPYQETP